MEGSCIYITYTSNYNTVTDMYDTSDDCQSMLIFNIYLYIRIPKQFFDVILEGNQKKCIVTNLKGL